MEFFLGFSLPQWAAIFSILGVVIGLTKPFRLWIKKIWVKTLGRKQAQLNRIEQELTGNGGSALRDIVNEIAARQQGFDAFLTASLNIHDDAVFRTDAEGKVIFTNRAHQRLTGFSQGEAYGDGWVNYLAPNERSRMVELWKDVIETGRELNEDIMFMRPDHSEYLVRAHVYREIDGRGNLRGYLGIIYPIDDEGCINHHKCFEEFQKLLGASRAENRGTQEM